MNRNKELIKRIQLQNIAIIKSCGKLRMDIANSVLTRQLIKSSTPVGANYSEACEAISIKDRISKVSISRKEAKESVYWIDLINSLNNNVFSKELTEESTAILKIMSSIQSKTNS